MQFMNGSAVIESPPPLEGRLEKSRRAVHCCPFLLRALRFLCGGSGGIGRVHIVIQILDEAAAALVLLLIEALPLCEDVVVLLEHGTGLGKLHAVAVAALADMIHHDGIDALGLQVRAARP